MGISLRRRRRLWRSLTTASLVPLLVGCAVPKIKDDAASVRLVVAEQSVGDCTYLGEVVGSAGRWFNFWMIANKTLTVGAVSDLKNDAWVMGADTVLLPVNTEFQTSVTYLGMAYRCGSR